MSFLRDLLARLFSGGITHDTREHPWFGTMTRFRTRDGSKSWWEAELPIAEPPGKVSITLEGGPDGPGEAEEAFCRRTVADFDDIFERCRPALDPVFREWAAAPMPADWREAFGIDGFSVPPGGDPDGEWEMTWFVDRANHWFTAVFDGGVVKDVYVDG